MRGFEPHRLAGGAAEGDNVRLGGNPDRYKALGSLEFSKLLLEKAKVAVSPGIGFGEGGDEFVRFSLVENEHRIRQAVRGIRELF